MIVSIYFGVSFLVCYVLLLMFKKNDRRLSITNHLVLTYIGQLCIGAVYALPLSLISVPVNLVTMAVLYNLLSAFLLVYLLKRREWQKYYFDLYDTINFVIMILFIGFVFWRVFSFDINLSYFNTDIANHFEFAMNIVRTGKLNSMYFASLNNALFIQFMEPVFSGIYTYKSMIIAETVSNCLSGMIFYVLISYPKRSVRFKMVSPIITILYFAGWPLYQYALGGFVYWGIGVTLFLFGLYLLYLYRDFQNVRKQVMIALLVVVYCVAICYVLFVPYVVAIYLLCLLSVNIKEGKNYERIKRLLPIACIVSVVAVVVMAAVLIGYFKDVDFFFTSLARDGGIHKEVYRDYIYFIPLICYLGSQLRKKKEFNLNYFCLLCYTFFVIISLVLCFAGIVSPYYYYKFYFILWALVWLVVCDAVDKILVAQDTWLYSYAGVLFFLCAFTFTPLEEKFIEKGLIQDSVVEFPLYSAVGSYLKNPAETNFDDPEYWEVMEYLENAELVLPIVTDEEYSYWYTSFFNVKCFTSDEFEKMNHEFSDGIVIHKRSDAYTNYGEVLEQEHTVLYENRFAAVYGQ